MTRHAALIPACLLVLAILVSAAEKKRYEYYRKFFEPTEDVVTPHIAWAKPYARAPVRVLFITHRNAMAHFDFDPFVHIRPEEATVGSLRSRAAHVDVGPSEPRKPFVAPTRPLTLTDMLLRAEHPLLDEQARSEGLHEGTAT